jgi:hypothetical protein
VSDVVETKLYKKVLHIGIIDEKLEYIHAALEWKWSNTKLKIFINLKKKVTLKQNVIFKV